MVRAISPRPVHLRPRVHSLERYFPAPARRWHSLADDNYCRWDAGRRDSRPRHRRHSGDSHSRRDCRPDCHPDWHSGALQNLVRGTADDTEDAEAVPLAHAAAGIAGPGTYPARRKAVAPTQAARSSTAGAQEAAPSLARKVSCGNAFSFHHYSAVVRRLILQ